MKSASSDEPSGSQGDCEGQEPCQSEAPLISLDSRLATRMGSSEKGVCDVSQAEGVESATEGRCGEPGRVFPIAWGGSGPLGLCWRCILGRSASPGSTAELAPYLAARGFAVARSRAHVERQAKSAAPAAAT